MNLYHKIFLFVCNGDNRNEISVGLLSRLVSLHKSNEAQLCSGYIEILRTYESYLIPLLLLLLLPIIRWILNDFFRKILLREGEFYYNVECCHTTTNKDIVIGIPMKSSRNNCPTSESSGIISINRWIGRLYIRTKWEIHPEKLKKIWKMLSLSHITKPLENPKIFFQ